MANAKFELTGEAVVRFGVSLRRIVSLVAGPWAQFVAAVEKTHGDSATGKEYAAAVHLADLLVDPAKTE